MKKITCWLLGNVFYSPEHTASPTCEKVLEPPVWNNDIHDINAWFNSAHDIVEGALDDANTAEQILKKTHDFREMLQTPDQINVGEIGTRTDVQTFLSGGEFRWAPEYITEYPQMVIDALGELFQEYNEAFDDLVAKNKEWDSDYQYCLVGPNNEPQNFFVQIDMVGLPKSFLSEVSQGEYTHQEVKEIMRSHIFEIENSMAMYQLLSKIFQRWEEASAYDRELRSSLDSIRERFGKPIALLAVTPEKYQALLESELWVSSPEELDPDTVQELTGFDTILGPEEFHQMVDSNNGESPYLLYTRASLPTEQLKKPNGDHEITSLVDDDAMRKVIKANTITMNIDPSDMDPERKINDTKEYMEQVWMAYSIDQKEDLFSQELIDHLRSWGSFAEFDSNNHAFNIEFRQFLAQHGINQEDIKAGHVELRGKPRKETYGCYGHHIGRIGSKQFRSKLRNSLKTRDGGYVIQVEMPTPVIEDPQAGESYKYIDRNFFTVDDEWQPVFMSGFRSLMPVNTTEAKKGRVHGNDSTIWAEVMPEKA